MELTKQSPEVKKLLDSIDTILFDCDGVIWHGNELIPNVRETLDYVRSQGKRVIFVSNNSTKSREGYLKKFKSLGIEASVVEVIGSSYTAAYYIKHVAKFPEDKKIYVIGEDGITEELDRVGIKWVGGHHQDTEYLVGVPHNELKNHIKPDDSIEAVLVGFDGCFNYRKLAKAHCYLRYNKKCAFYATNEDATLPIDDVLYPGTGTIVSAISCAIGKEPLFFGKPHKPMMEAILKQYQLNPERTLMVGDRLNTDIKFGLNSGLKTLLVLTGVSKKQDITQDCKPEFIADSIAVLSPY